MDEEKLKLVREHAMVNGDKVVFPHLWQLEEFLEDYDALMIKRAQILIQGRVI